MQEAIEKAKANAAELRQELQSVTQRLKRRALEEKRQQVYADGQRALADLSREEFEARRSVEDLSDLKLDELLLKYGLFGGGCATTEVAKEAVVSVATSFMVEAATAAAKRAAAAPEKVTE